MSILRDLSFQRLIFSTGAAKSLYGITRARVLRVELWVGKSKRNASLLGFAFTLSGFNYCARYVGRRTRQIAGTQFTVAPPQHFLYFLSAATETRDIPLGLTASPDLGYIRQFMKLNLGLEMRPANTQEVQLICNCCGQPYYPDKSWEDRLRAVIFGAERFAICPLCTQSPPQDVFENPKYRRRCLCEVQRLQRMLEKSRKDIQKRSV